MTKIQNHPPIRLVSVVRERALTGPLRTAQDLLLNSPVRTIVEDFKFYDFVVNQDSDFIEFFINKPLKLKVVTLTLEQNEALRLKYNSK